ncbi:MAG: hypothetical protein AAF657_26205, partial [Acidobacteriota bacterium]
MATLSIVGALVLFATGCKPSQATPAATATEALEPATETVELATLMGDMQRHSAKLGFAIQGKNQPLAQFYLEELHEVLEE